MSNLKSQMPARNASLAIAGGSNVLGFTLIELLIVISITGILSVMAFVNFKKFASDSSVDIAAGEVQSFLRLAQSNATSSTFCNKVDGKDIYGVDWKVTFNSGSVVITCGSIDTPYKTLTLPEITITPDCSSVVYTALKGMPVNECSISLQKGTETRTVTLTSGGGIDIKDVQ